MVIMIKLCIVIVTVVVFYRLIILPVVREYMRHKLFSIRDDLRLAHADGRIQREAFLIVQDSINTMIKYIKEFDMYEVLCFSARYRENDDLRRQIQEKKEILERAESPELREIVGRYKGVQILIAPLNSLFFMVFAVVVLLIPMLLFDGLKSSIKSVFEAIRFLDIKEYEDIEICRSRV